MKRVLKTKKSIKIAILVALLVVLSALIFLFNKQRLDQTYYQRKVENTVKAQITPLREVLTSFGFTELSNLDTKCGYVTHETIEGTDQAISGGRTFECSSGIDRYIKVPTDSAGISLFNQNASKLSQLLLANGWQSRPDFPTIPWFQKISEGVDYQPDQLNEKKVGDFDCIVDFFTAYSKLHDKDPAISMRIYCSMTSQP